MQAEVTPNVALEQAVAVRIHEPSQLRNRHLSEEHTRVVKVLDNRLARELDDIFHRRGGL